MIISSYPYSTWNNPELHQNTILQRYFCYFLYGDKTNYPEAFLSGYITAHKVGNFKHFMFSKLLSPLFQHQYFQKDLILCAKI